MEIRIDIVKLFGRACAIGIKAVKGSCYTVGWGDGQSESFSGTGKPQRHAHEYTGYPERQNYSVMIEAAPDAIIGIFLRYAALIDDIPPVRLSGIDVSRCASLEQLALPQFSGIGELNLNGNPNLRNLSLECHSLPALDLTGNPRLEYLYLALCRNLKVLDLSGCQTLKVLDIVGTYALEELYLNDRCVLNKVKLSSDTRRRFNPDRLMDIVRRNRAQVEYF